MKTNALKKFLALAAVAALAAPLAAAAKPPPQRPAPQVHPGQMDKCAIGHPPTPRGGPRHHRPPQGHRPHGYSAWYWAPPPPPPPPPCWAYYPPPPPPPPPPAYYYYRPGWSVSFAF